ncbi:hypothetical protein [Streptomyces sp. NPDC059533]|uniref:hypothetical protein n=1 Tax=unclassified Streptomyces TaxID=2593676 RepID=UPI0036AB76BD
MLDVEGNNPDAGTSVLIWHRKSVGAQNQLWTRTTDGHILSQLTGGNALAWDDSKQELVTAVVGESDLYQLWSITSDGYITNQGMGGDVLSANADITLWDFGISFQAVNPSAFQQWSLLAPLSSASTAPGWAYFQSALQDGNSQNCVLNVEGDRTSAGTPVIAWPIAQDPPGISNELWQVTPDGRIVSAQGNNLVLTLSSSVSEADDGYFVVVDTQRDPLPLSQVWDLSTPNQIRSAYTGDFLCPSGGTQGPIVLEYGPNIVAAPGTPGASYTWYTVPLSPLPLNEIVAHDSVPFPVYTDERAIAYNDILSQLGLQSLRAQYYNLNADLDIYYDEIVNMTTIPTGVSQDAWTNVRDQLESEIQYASTARNLFANYTNFQNTLFAAKDCDLNKLISDAGITDNPDVGGTILAVLDGLMYAVLCALPGVGEGSISVGGIAGNLMMTGVNAALASGSDGMSSDPFQVAVSDLEGQLGDSFAAVLSAMGDMETTILKDWGMLSALYPLATQQGGPDSLFWDPSTTPDLVAAATPGYVTSVMQMLLPAKYMIMVREYPPDVPAWAQWQGPAGTYWITGTDPQQAVYPAEATLQSLWDNGVRQADFFQSAAGWAFSTSFETAGWPSLVFTNMTNDMLQLTTSDDEVSYLQDGRMGPGQSCILSPSESCSLQVTDFNSPLIQVAQIPVHVTWFEPTIEFGALTAVSGYQFTAPINGGTARVGLTRIPDIQA